MCIFNRHLMQKRKAISILCSLRKFICQLVGHLKVMKRMESQFFTSLESIIFGIVRGRCNANKIAFLFYFEFKTFWCFCGDLITALGTL